MDEMRPRGHQGAAGWDGVERRTAVARPAAGRSPWRSPDRMRGQVVIGGTVGIVVMVVAGLAQFLTDHIQVIVR
ncbi:hypothetical protein [Kitasatospora purpeofusca]|uniref:hypothetical protein n=1 Tax=Kitasatospora purpeofusca TaxID=67352 RepID=UPI0022507D2E|nr:hypothetical protein [Kitasatospora purpeofusca]MCX4682714.1 hypothetical protein [Kitasatospora purpeofusca]MCX4690622.1 hypothetical protein [Kitasatospora purpeofusca]MCX4690804.1 hypothetical protein [Kitasatospora purpeofusca]